MNQKEAKMKLHRLKEIRAELAKEVELLQGKIAGLDLAIATIEGDDTATMPIITDHKSIKKRIPMKGAVISYLEQAASNGLNADEAVEKSGGKFDRASVSSLLSRLKGIGIAAFMGDRYYLVKFAPKPSALQIPASSIVN